MVFVNVYCFVLLHNKLIDIRMYYHHQMFLNLFESTGG